MTLVDSIIQYAASDKLDGDAWATLVRSSIDYSTVELPDVLKNTETEFKERTGHTAMPSRWRSAKSVLLKARNAMITLMDDNGQVLGKSAIEKMVTATKPASPTASVFDRADTFIAELHKLVAEYSAVAPGLKSYIKDEVYKIC